MTDPGKSAQTGKNLYVTRTGLPLLVEFKWPFHSSTAGADFWVLHADVKLGNSEGLHAPVAVNLSATVREVLPSMEAKDVEGPVVNALRTAESYGSPALIPCDASAAPSVFC